MVALAPSARAANPCPDGQSCLSAKIVSATGTQTRLVTVAQLLDASDLPDRGYRLGATRALARYSLEAKPGTSIDALLDNVLGTPHQSVSYVTLTTASDGSTLTLDSSTDDFVPEGQSGFPFDDGPPAFFTTSDGSSLTYVQPLRTGSDAGNNDLQTFDTNDNAGKDPSLQLTVNLIGTLLHPTVSADRTSVAVGQQVTITVDPHDSTPGLDYSVDFGDGSPPGTGSDTTGAHTFTVTHRFETKGQYRVTAQVTSTDANGDIESSGSTAQYVQIDVHVGPTTATTPPDHPTTTGANQATGGTTAPPAGPNSASGSKPGGAPTGSAVPVAGGSSGAVSRSGVPTASGSVASSRPGSTGSRSAGSAAAPDAGGNLVAGYVLAGGENIPTGASAAASRPPVAPAARASVSTGRIAVGVLAALGVLCLLALGAGAELRRPLRAARRRAR